MAEGTVSQLVKGTFTDRFSLRRRIDSAIRHLDSAVKQLSNLEGQACEYDPDYLLMTREIVQSILPVRNSMCALRRTTFAWEKARAGQNTGEKVVSQLEYNERSRAMERIRAYVEPGVVDTGGS